MGLHRTDVVSSGSFELGTTQPRRLQAILGTCVGVAVYDDNAGVGGIVHLLLPEPISPTSIDFPEKYATTGMPLFLDQLIEKGATIQHMKAVVAGGALVGPLTHQDISLDIGGRTVEKVTETLDNYGITVADSETGGFFTCCIELDMQQWHCQIRPIGFDSEVTGETESKSSTIDIRHAIDSIKPIPQVALKVLRLIEDGTYDTEKIAEEVKKDQVISARTIQLCNSALFSKRQDVASLDHALVFLGQNLFVKLIISAAVQSYFGQCGNGYSLCKGGIYHHAIGTAMVSEKIANTTGKAVPGVAYTAGLLHDIGKVVLDQYIIDAYPMLYREFQDRQNEIIGVETKALGLDHTRAGEVLAKKWALPNVLVDAIRFHHQPGKSVHDRSLTTIVYLADLLMSRFHSGLELERIGTESLVESLARLDLTTEEFSHLVDLIPEKVFEPADESGEDAF